MILSKLWRLWECFGSIFGPNTSKANTYHRNIYRIRRVLTLKWLYYFQGHLLVYILEAFSLDLEQRLASLLLKYVATIGLHNKNYLTLLYLIYYYLSSVFFKLIIVKRKIMKGMSFMTFAKEKFHFSICIFASTSDQVDPLSDHVGVPKETPLRTTRRL